MNRTPKQRSDQFLKYISSRYYTVDGKLYCVYKRCEVGTHHNGHLRINVRSENKSQGVLVHHIIWYFHKGYWPTKQIDHKDRNKRNNKIDNLREVNDAIQRINKHKESGLPPGVVKTRNRTFQAQIRINKDQTYLGIYKTPEEAFAVYKNKYKEIYGEELDV